MNTNEMPRSSLTRAGGWLLHHYALVVLGAGLAWATFRTPYDNGPPIRSDGYGYHLWTYAFLRGDVNFAHITGEVPEAGIYVADPQRRFLHNKYAPGMAIVRLPVMAFLADSKSPGAVTDAEHGASLCLGALALLATAALGFASCRVVGAPAWAANLAVLGVVFGTGLFHYATYDGGFSHIYSALGLTILLYEGLRSTRPGAGGPSAWRTAPVVTLLVLIRNTNVVAIGLMTIAYGWHLWRAGRLDRRALRGLTLAVVLPGVVGVAIQVALNSHAHGHLKLSSYAQESFDWSNPMALSVLFAPNHSLFAYYPALTVALISGLIVRRTRVPTLLFAGLLLAYAVLYGFWHCWWLGAGFGHRGFVELCPLAIPLLAAALADARGALRVVVIVLTCLAALACAQLMDGYWHNTLPWEFLTWDDYYDHVLGRRSWLQFWRAGG